jgi:divalent metal cation (Fe/Co/Zn/Cd) transporter
MTLREAHAIADQVAARVEALSVVGQAFVHVEPDHQGSLTKPDDAP